MIGHMFDLSSSSSSPRLWMQHHREKDTQHVSSRFNTDYQVKNDPNTVHSVKASNHHANSTTQHNNNNNNGNNNIKNQKPWLVLHVGPQKTMSSAMQCTLHFLQSTLAREDSYQFLGKVDMRACGIFATKIGPLEAPLQVGDCVQAILNVSSSSSSSSLSASTFSSPSSSSSLLRRLRNQVPCWKEFDTLLNEYASNHTNLILSDEKLSELHLHRWNPTTTRDLWSIVLQRLRPQWNIRIIVVYRRYYPWLASLKNQGDKYSLGRVGMKSWEGPEMEAIFPQLLRWMSNTTEIPSPYTPAVYEFYGQELQRLSVNQNNGDSSDNGSLSMALLNMHNTTVSLMDTFLCESIPMATHACRAYRDHPELYNKYESNPSIVPFYDNIAFTAYHQGIVRDRRGFRRGADRIFITEMIGRRQNRLHSKPYDLPLICPTWDDVQPLLQQTLHYEATFLPEFFHSDQGEVSIRDQFDKDFQGQKFCTVNVTAVLVDPEWRKFLANQWHPKRGTKSMDWENTHYSITNVNYSSPRKQRERK
jgi:hypothetical protein